MNAHFMLIPVASRRRLERQIDLVIERKARCLERLSERDPVPERLAGVLYGTRGPIPHHRIHGHLPIFLSHGLRALDARPERATPAVVEGLPHLLGQVQRGSPQCTGSPARRNYASEQEMVKTAFARILRSRGRTRPGGRRGP